MKHYKITEKDVMVVLKKGKTIRNYPEDKPYPSKLILGFIKKRPIHIVAAENTDSDEIIVITVYEPEVGKWDERFVRKLK